MLQSDDADFKQTDTHLFNYEYLDKNFSNRTYKITLYFNCSVITKMSSLDRF